MTAHPRAVPHYLAAERAAAARLAAERAARIEYTGLPWAQRLVTPPPVGWPGGYIGRAVGWCQERRRPVCELNTVEVGGRRPIAPPTPVSGD